MRVALLFGTAISRRISVEDMANSTVAISRHQSACGLLGGSCPATYETCFAYSALYCPDWEGIALAGDCIIPQANQICCDQIPAPCRQKWTAKINGEGAFCSKSKYCLKPSCSQKEHYLSVSYPERAGDASFGSCFFASAIDSSCAVDSAPFGSKEHKATLIVPAKKEYSRHAKNCFAGHGADSLGNYGTSLTKEECLAKCDEDMQCTGVVRAGGHEFSQCFAIRNIQFDQCLDGNFWVTWAKPVAASLLDRASYGSREAVAADRALEAKESAEVQPIDTSADAEALMFAFAEAGDAHTSLAQSLSATTPGNVLTVNERCDRIRKRRKVCSLATDWSNSIHSTLCKYCLEDGEELPHCPAADAIDSSTLDFYQKTYCKCLSAASQFSR
mmetsp:Transcript_2292/g.5072  ORF Transcript_2292/g.5072 Transcript_2292/m.5072 type:complete len:388 (-) Transcript_2292:24-1187(-)|eukprot:CAMPEP_0204270070 /NCGR_PEP_ID=MMETSP0468-20130131/18080_1 /ASSEMBLY_ACC=CAM_ASM_000383 /TAXON_ID=2969 /ORGANISM="Oxyrrhis marina" /LENGTH=387 /DNA_ID=CAMNT_0051245557 /DNA_START=68 /DNA_END=1231 /DNA_ORIENTATION=+